MPYLSDFPELPFTVSDEELATACSKAGAKQAQPKAGSQSSRMLALYAEGPLTDHAMAERAKLPLATVCARRNWLMNAKYVRAVGVQVGPCGAENTLWGLR